MIESFITFFVDHFVISLIWFFLFIALVYITILCLFANFSEISCYKAVQLINREGSIIIDIRNQHDFYREYILNSIHFSASDIRSGSACGLFKFQGKSLIVVCNDGVVSCSIARYLYTVGFRDIYVLKGGIISWKNAGLPLIRKQK